MFLVVMAALLAAGPAGGRPADDKSGATGKSGGSAANPMTNQPPAASAKPLLLDDEKPLLLDDESPTNSPAGGADNSRCQVCHINFMQEALTVSHAKTNIGCATCHGACDAHIADESWASGGNGTAPDIMFPRFKIYGACIACHTPEQVFVKVEKHQPFWWAIAYQERVCTDCHGQHRMVNRKCKWK